MEKDDTFIFGGIDLGGTKLSAGAFSRTFEFLENREWKTPDTYLGLLNTLTDAFDWLRIQGATGPIGISAAGLHRAGHPSIAANLAAHGAPFADDIGRRTENRLIWINDGAAFTLAEARFGAGRGEGITIGLCIGTGIGGGMTVHGTLPSPGGTLRGEFGHIALPVDLVDRFDLPLLDCGCGQRACFETLASGNGLANLAYHLTGRKLTSHKIVGSRSTETKEIWSIWSQIIAALLHQINLMVEPQRIVLGGGMSEIPGLLDDLSHHFAPLCWQGHQMPKLAIARFGNDAAMLGAAFAASLADKHWKRTS